MPEVEKNEVMKKEINRNDIDEQFEPPEKVENELENVGKRIENLISFQSNYTKKLLKFGIAAWIFGISIFISVLTLYKGPELFLNAPPLSISLLIGAIAAPITVSAVFLRKKQKKKRELENIKSNLLERYEKAIILSEKEKMEKRKDFLHSLLRHDVRNKAQVALGYQELLDELELPEKGEEYIEKSKKVIKDSINLIEKVRTLKDIEEEEIKKLNVESILEYVVDSYKDQASENEISFELEKCNVTVKAGDFLKELFSNLIENSIQHSGCSKIKISNRVKKNECIIIVEDNGKGIPEEKKERIFERGYMAGENAGSGLGTYIAKKIAEYYGGSIKVKDSELGGARFDVRLQKA